MRSLLKHAFLFWFGGSFYVTLEIIYRERSHWTMIVLAGIVFLIVGGLNEVWSWSFPLSKQVLIGTTVATVLEFFTGCIVNLWLRWNVWSYEGMWGNILGQICPLFILFWVPLILIAILIDDQIRYRFFDEEKPRYKLW